MTLLRLFWSWLVRATAALSDRAFWLDVVPSSLVEPIHCYVKMWKKMQQWTVTALHCYSQLPHYSWDRGISCFSSATSQLVCGVHWNRAHPPLPALANTVRFTNRHNLALLFFPPPSLRIWHRHPELGDELGLPAIMSEQPPPSKRIRLSKDDLRHIAKEDLILR